MPKVRLIRHDGVPSDCGSYEVRVPWPAIPLFLLGRSSIPAHATGQMTGAQALALAKLLARGLSMTNVWAKPSGGSLVTLS
jgi:hypothetical protein